MRIHRHYALSWNLQMEGICIKESKIIKKEVPSFQREKYGKFSARW
jgi:hypothetical protein